MQNALATAGRPMISVADLAEARRRMVDGQLRPNRVTDPALLAAMGELPRELFLPTDLAARAYADEDVALPGGRVLIQPMMIARLIQLLALRDGDRLLVVASATGYAAAVAACCGARAVAVEEDAALVSIARHATAGLVAPGALRLVQGKVTEGAADAAPYDAILIEGAIPAVPDAIAGQLAEGGRLATVLAGAARGVGSRAVLGRRVGGALTLTDAFDCATASLPAFRPRPGFVF
ncbi:protein-L-isoaspartate O-methyltransferase family protein [Falsiroseomonas sp. HW251]|uniref:protein-L-isoaspartate O-methyltransferase family protein n=1 Tax=Falsiroseomonas sp. HW251 TaxID=3390998 RepID=UPI003D310E81